MPFQELVTTIRGQKSLALYKGYLICYDPGETTGYAIFRGCKLLDYGQYETKDLSQSWPVIYKQVECYTKQAQRENLPIRSIIEDYRIYGWKADSHKWEELHTAKLIGMLIAALTQHGTTYQMQMAQIGKGFCTDDKLRLWGMYKPGMRHARDAIRHGTHFLLFG